MIQRLQPSTINNKIQRLPYKHLNTTVFKWKMGFNNSNISSQIQIQKILCYVVALGKLQISLTPLLIVKYLTIPLVSGQQLIITSSLITSSLNHYYGVNQRRSNLKHQVYCIISWNRIYQNFTEMQMKQYRMLSFSLIIIK